MERFLQFQAYNLFSPLMFYMFYLRLFYFCIFCAIFIVILHLDACLTPHSIKLHVIVEMCHYQHWKCIHSCNCFLMYFNLCMFYIYKETAYRVHVHVHMLHENLGYLHTLMCMGYKNPIKDVGRHRNVQLWEGVQNVGGMLDSHCFSLSAWLLKYIQAQHSCGFS